MTQELFSTHNRVPSVSSDLHDISSFAPLPHRMRPQTLNDFFGQKHILEEGKLLNRIIIADKLQSAILFGPAGCGKTTLAHIIARMTHATFIQINAVDSNSQQLRKIISAAEVRKLHFPDKKTILFIDEIHRFNKAQQDILMPVVEKGIIILIGATTHNPSFSIIGPLLSRSMLFELQPLSNVNLRDILKRALTDSENGYGQFSISYDDEALDYIADQAHGDARRALIALEIAVNSSIGDDVEAVHINKACAVESVQKKAVNYDANGDYHYDTISAFIKSMRGSDPDASIYWLAKMLEAGEDPLFIARRIIILASEDIGNADPHALQIAVSALQAIQFVGLPEGRIVLSQAVLYMACAPKSNASYTAIEAAMNDIRTKEAQEVPSHLRDSHYASAKKMNRGVGYKYPHSFSGNFVKQSYMNTHNQYYYPTQNGYEKTIKQRLVLLKKQNNGESTHDI